MSKIADISELLLEMGVSAAATETQRAIAQAALNKAEGAVKRHLLYDPVQSVRTEFYPGMDFSQVSKGSTWEVNSTQAYTRFLAGAATNELQVQGLPIRSLDKDGANAVDLRIDYDGRSGARSGSFAAGTQKTEGSDFWPNYDTVDSNGYSVARDGVFRSEGRWPDQPGSVKIVYVAGYTDEELHGTDDVIDASPILEAVIDEAMRRVHKIYSKMKSRAGFTGPFTSESLGDYSYSVDSAILAQWIGGGDISPQTVHKLSNFVNIGVALGS